MGCEQRHSRMHADHAGALEIRWSNDRPRRDTSDASDAPDAFIELSGKPNKEIYASCKPTPDNYNEATEAHDRAPCSLPRCLRHFWKSMMPAIPA